MEELTLADLRTLKRLLVAEQASLFSHRQNRDKEQRAELARINLILSNEIEHRAAAAN